MAVDLWLTQRHIYRLPNGLEVVAWHGAGVTWELDAEDGSVYTVAPDGRLLRDGEDTGWTSGDLVAVGIW